MCGVAGRFHPEALPRAQSWSADVDKLLAHRGPDGGGRYLDQNCELVQRRLSIVDVTATGDQPIWNEDGSVCIIFNGEIYNHRDLRAELRSQGHVFRGRSDTEVLVHLYEQDGPGMLARLRGMFAFAIYDKRKRRLLLARDRFGIKPLYYSINGKEFIFSSEIKAILALPGFRYGIDRQACYDYLGLGYVAEPSTGFEEIRMLAPGSRLVVDTNGARVDRFYELRARPRGDSELAGVTEAVSAALSDAVRRQLVADVPVAGLLSGGIDSSLVVAAQSRASGEPSSTFNVRFPGREFDETRMALAVSSTFDTRHRTIDLRDWTLTPELLVELLEHFDQPFADMSLVPTYLLSLAIKEQGIKCALSGDGGDETFGGYARFWRVETLSRLLRLPSWTLRSMSLAGKSLAGVTADLGRQIAKAARLGHLGKRDLSILIAGLANYLNEEEKELLVLPAAREGLVPVYRHFAASTLNGASAEDVLSAAFTENLFAIGLPSDMLKKVDMMSMKAGVEIRVPMLDEELVQLGLSLPHRLKANRQAGKLVLRALARQWLPASVAAHPKHGFDIPLERMLAPRFQSMLEDYLLARESRIGAVVDVDLVAKWLRLFRRLQDGRRTGSLSREGLSQRIFILLALELWLRRHRLSW